jgi:hypothetical protein
MAARSIIFNSRYYWRDLYAAAILEMDNERLPKLIHLAEESIGLRLISLTGSEEDCTDLREIKAALESLELLKHESLSKRHRSAPN